jgi:hypothetical protein
MRRASELSAIHTGLKTEYPDAYPDRADMRIAVAALRDQIAAPARPILLILLAAAAWSSSSPARTSQPDPRAIGSS